MMQNSTMSSESVVRCWLTRVIVAQSSTGALATLELTLTATGLGIVRQCWRWRTEVPYEVITAVATTSLLLCVSGGA